MKRGVEGRIITWDGSGGEVITIDGWHHRFGPADYDPRRLAPRFGLLVRVEARLEPMKIGEVQRTRPRMVNVRLEAM